MKTSARVTVRFLHRTAKDIRAEIRRLVAGFKAVSRISHTVAVTVVRHPSLGGPDVGYGFGFCGVPKNGSGPVRIYLAAGLARMYHAEGGTRKEAVRAVGHCLLHEFAHYEQWRDGLPLVEKGVNARARLLYRLIDNSPGRPRKEA